MPAGFSGMRMRQKAEGEVVTRKPVLPGEAEVASNKRSKSAKLRVFEKD